MLKAVLSRKDLKKSAEYYGFVRDIIENEQLSRLKDFRHHLGTTRFQHSVNVSYYNYLLCRKFGLDARSAARAGLLHDLFFYDRKNSPRRHISSHPKAALSNASAMFRVNETEKEMIAEHMWPLTKRLPKRRETYVITFVDKFCAIAEVAAALTRLHKNKK